MSLPAELSLSSPAATPASSEESAAVSPKSATTGGEWRWLAAFLGIILVGLAARLALATAYGYGGDYRWFRDWTETAARDGFAVLYAKPDMNYPPLHVLTMRFFGELWQQFDATVSIPDRMGVYLRIPAIVADLVIALLLFFEGRRLMSARGGLIVAALYYLNPVAMYATAYWCQVDSIHSALLLAALVAVNRKQPLACGAFTALALLQKLQSLFCVPVLIFEVYRYLRWRGLGWWSVGAAAATLAVCTPLALEGVVSTAFQKGYANVVGQYPENSTAAYNVWYALGYPDASDTATPPQLARFAANGAATVDARQHWFLSHPRFALTFRKLSIVGFGLCVALLLTALATRGRHDQRAFIAGAMVLAAFTVLTEMHERYAYPVMALWPLWVGVRPGRQVIYWLASMLIGINVVGVLDPEQIQMHIGGAFVALLAWTLIAAWSGGGAAGPDVAPPERQLDPVPGPSIVVRAFCVLTIVVWLAALGGGAWFARAWSQLPAIRTEGVSYLSELTPVSERNGWKRMRRDESISGAPLRIGSEIHLRGLGTHGPARIDYLVPPNAARMEARVSVPLIPNSRARVRCRVWVDGKAAWTSGFLIAGDVADCAVDVAGAARLVIEVDSLGANSGDHVDWCDAKFVLQSPASTNAAEPMSDK